MSDVPRARLILEELEHDLRLAGRFDFVPAVVLALDLMHRRRPARRRAPVTSAPVGNVLAATIRRYARQNPQMRLDEIAAHFRCNPGRVSEALRGFR